MQKAAQAYSENAKNTGNPREREADLLIKAAYQLQKVKDQGIEDKSALNDALIYNRKLWTVFATSVAGAENPLPQDIRNNIASLGVFIFKHTVDIQVNPEPDKLNTLISINREIAAGLRVKAA